MQRFINVKQHGLNKHLNIFKEFAPFPKWWGSNFKDEEAPMQSIFFDKDVYKTNKRF